MTTKTAEKNNYVCPACGQRLARDVKGRGYVRHLDKPRQGVYCPLERGKKSV